MLTSDTVRRQMIRDRLAAFVTEHLAHLWLRLACLLVMHQAALLDGSALDALALQQDGLPPAEMDIRRGQIVQALVIALVYTAKIMMR